MLEWATVGHKKKTGGRNTLLRRISQMPDLVR
jgi:hypothetical protein